MIRQLSLFAENGALAYQIYEKSLKKHRQITFTLAPIISAITGYQVSGSASLSACASLLTIIPLWSFRKRLWKDLQPEFMTDEWKYCIAAIDKTVKQLQLTHTSDEYVFKYPLVLNLPMLYLYQRNYAKNFSLLPERVTQVSNEKLYMALHFIRFARAAYGDVDIGIPPEDIVSTELSGGPEIYPRHFIAIDHEHRTVVLAVRGTKSFGDLITDLICESAEFLSGKAHRGIKEVSQLLFQKTFGTICQALNEWQGYSLTITGHSLGAGISIVLTLLFFLAQRRKNQNQTLSLSLPERLEMLLEENELPVSTVIKCYAFAPPPVFAPLESLPKQFTDSVNVLQMPGILFHGCPWLRLVICCI